MRIAYNPKTAQALMSAPNNEDITFDLSGLAIYVKGVKFEGKAYSVFKKYTLNTTGGYDGLVPAPSYTETTERYLREDGTWVVPTNTNYYRPISVNGTSILGNNNTALNLVAGTNISITAENSSGYTGKVTITNTGVRSVTTGTTNGTISVNTNGTSADVAVKGLGSAAYLNKNLLANYTKGNNYIAFNLYDSSLYSVGLGKGYIEYYDNGAWYNSRWGWVEAIDGFKGSLTGNAETATKLQTARTLTIGDTGKTFDGSANVSWDSTEIGFRHEWNATIKGTVWSRLCYVQRKYIAEGSTYILKVSATRSSVVYSNTYLITAHHCAGEGHVVLLGGSNYSLLEIRILTDNSGSSYVEILDNAYKIAATSTLTVHCSLIPISCGTITKYTEFTDGTTLPSGYVSGEILKTLSYKNSIQASNFVGNLVGNASSAAKLQTPRTIWGLHFDGSANVSGDMTGVGSISASGIISTPALYGLGTHGGSKLYFGIRDGLALGIEPYDKDGTWLNNGIQLFLNGNVSIGSIANSEKLYVNGNVKATTFKGNLDGSYINKLTNYTKATALGAIAATDSLNTALGKLEYKADVAYDWIIGVTATDTDEYINKWGEIVGFLDSVKEGTDILDEFVTRKTDQVVSGKKLFNNQLIIRKDVGNTGASVTNQQHKLLLQVMRYSDTHSVAIGVMPNGSGVIWAKANGIGYNTLYLNPHSNGVAIGCGDNTLPALKDGYYLHIFGSTLANSSITATKFITSGGTSSQFVKGDGSLDSTTYATAASLNNYVTLNTEQTITGLKTFKTNTGNIKIEDASVKIDMHHDSGWARCFEIINTNNSKTVTSKFGAYGHGNEDGNNVLYYTFISHGSLEYNNATLKIYDNKATISGNEIYHKGNLKNLSDLNDDIVSGKYLPLTGGTMEGTIHMNNNMLTWSGNTYSWDNTPNGFLGINTSLTDKGGYYGGIHYKQYYGLQLRVAGGDLTKFEIRGHNGDYWGNWGKLWHSKNMGENSGLNADLLDGLHKKDFKQIDVNHYSYTPNLALYSVSKGQYCKISIKNVKNIWTMMNVELSIRENYINRLYGKVLIDTEKNNLNSIRESHCTLLGNFSDKLKVYIADSDTFDIYIAGDWSYATIDVSRLLFGDSAASVANKEFTISTVTSLPESYVTPTLSIGLTSKNYSNYIPAITNYVTLNTAQTITGAKTFNLFIQFKPNTTGGNALGISNIDSAGDNNTKRSAGIGFMNSDGIFSGAYIGWGESPWSSANNLYVNDTTFTYKNYKIWHEGNDGIGSGLDADLFQGNGESAYFRYRGEIDKTYIEITDYNNDAADFKKLNNGTYSINKNTYSGLLLHLEGNGSTHALEITTDYWDTAPILVRKIVDNKRVSGAWKALAFTDSNITGNAASADKLKTARNLWGQSFDGTADVSGNMTGVGSIYMNNSSCLFVKNTEGSIINLLTLNSQNLFALGWSTCTNGYLTSIYGNVITFGTGSNRNEIMRLNSNGKVGIGATNPDSILHVHGVSNNGTPVLKVSSTSVTSDYNYVASFLSPNLGAGGNVIMSLGVAHDTKKCAIFLYIIDSDSSKNRLAIGHYGGIQMLTVGASNVGIGTTNPSTTYKLDVVSSTINVIRVKSSGNESSIAYDSASSSWTAGVGTGLSGNAFGFWSNTAGKNVLTVKSDDTVHASTFVGNVLLGKIHNIKSAVYNATYTSGTWYRIMVSDSDKVADATGELVMYMHSSGYPVTLKLSFGVSYHTYPFLLCNWHTGWSYELSKARIVYKTSYGSQKAYLEVYACANVTHETTFSFVGTGWSFMTPTATTEEYTENLNTKCEIELTPERPVIYSSTIKSKGFIKTDSNNSYVLLGGGGHKKLSDFLLKSEELTNNLTTITKTLTVTKDWMDTGISASDLETGTYAVQLYVNSSANGIWKCYWSGIMTWYADDTDDSDTDEIILHRSGHHYDRTIYLRTVMQAKSRLKLQIAASKAISSTTYTFKFKKLI